MRWLIGGAIQTRTGNMDFADWQAMAANARKLYILWAFRDLLFAERVKTAFGDQLSLLWCSFSSSKMEGLSMEGLSS